HFSGIAGQGMNPLARLMRAWGHDVQGSDRAFDQGKQRDLAATLTALGIRLVPQDGRAVVAGLDRFVYSTAVEAETPEVLAACESDGTLVGYRPRIGVILNVSRDHDELEALRRQFTTFAERCETLLVNAASAEARAIGAPLGARTFGSTSDADFRLVIESPGP